MSFSKGADVGKNPASAPLFYLEFTSPAFVCKRRYFWKFHPD